MGIAQIEIKFILGMCIVVKHILKNQTKYTFKRRILCFDLMEVNRKDFISFLFELEANKVGQFVVIITFLPAVSFFGVKDAHGSYKRIWVTFLRSAEITSKN